MMTTTIGSRACCRCWKDLTDAASMEVGVGPICRKMDNKLLATKIPSDVAAAQAAAALVIEADLPEPCRPTFGQVMADLMDFSTNDWRKTVKRIEWLLSWGMSPTMRKALITVVRALGYIGLGALLSGEAATGLTTITCEGGRLYLAGPRNKAARHAFKKIPGWKFTDAFNGKKATWSVPVAAYEKFHTLVMTYYPNFENLDESIVKAKEAVANTSVEFQAQENISKSAVQAKAEKAAPAIIISAPVDGWVKVTAPFNAYYLNDLKKLPHPERKWNSAEYVWEVSVKHIEHVKELIQKHFKVAATVAAA